MTPNTRARKSAGTPVMIEMFLAIRNAPPVLNVSICFICLTLGNFFDSILIEV